MGYRNTIHEIQETPGQDPFRFTLPGYFVTLWKVKLDGFVKSPSAALRFIFSHCGVLVSTPHS